ncbi:hypothetical protein AALF16_25745 [Bacillus cereus]
MTNHVNKGAQKSSVDQISFDPKSSHEKSKKMERYHRAYQQKAKEE